MSKTFDNIAEAAATNYLFLKAQMTISLAQEPPTPPPLYALSFLSELLCAALKRFLKRFATENSGLHKWASGPSWLGTDPGEDTGPSALVRNSTSSDLALRRMTEEESEALAKSVTQYVLDHQADVAQEERWRTTMQRKMDQHFRNIKDIQESVNSGFEELVKKEMKANRKEMKANRDQMDRQFKDLRAELGIGVVTSSGVVATVATV